MRIEKIKHVPKYVARIQSRLNSGWGEESISSFTTMRKWYISLILKHDHTDDLFNYRCRIWEICFFGTNFLITENITKNINKAKCSPRFIPVAYREDAPLLVVRVVGRVPQEIKEMHEKAIDQLMDRLQMSLKNRDE